MMEDLECCEDATLDQSPQRWEKWGLVPNSAGCSDQGQDGDQSCAHFCCEDLSRREDGISVEVQGEVDGSEKR